MPHLVVLTTFHRLLTCIFASNIDLFLNTNPFLMLYVPFLAEKNV